MLSDWQIEVVRLFHRNLPRELIKQITRNYENSVFQFMHSTLPGWEVAWDWLTERGFIKFAKWKVTKTSAHPTATYGFLIGDIVELPVSIYNEPLQGAVRLLFSCGTIMYYGDHLVLHWDVGRDSYWVELEPLK